MDTLANCVFGMEEDFQNCKTNLFFDRANELLDQGVKYGPFILTNSNDFNDLMRCLKEF